MVFSSAIALPVAGAATDEEPSDSTLYVDLEADGDASVSLVTVYDLSDEDERVAFETLQEDEETQDEMLERFADRLDSVANGVDDESMTVAADSVTVQETDGEGTLTLSVTWKQLATAEDDELVLDEPFASGFETDRRFVVTGPDDATVESATPAPNTEDGAELVWEAGTDLDGFDVTLSLPAEAAESAADADDERADTTDEKAADETPGSGVVAALASLGTVTYLLGRRSS